MTDRTPTSPGRHGRSQSTPTAVVWEFWIRRSDSGMKHPSSRLRHAVWGQIVAPLVALSACEGIYYSLTFMDYNWLRQDALNVMYTRAADDLRKLETTLEEGIRTYNGLDTLHLVDLIHELHVLCDIRAGVVSLYRSLPRSGVTLNYADLAGNAATLSQRTARALTHRLLRQIKSNVHSEVEILQRLLLAQVFVSQCEFTTPILLLYQCKSDLDAWRSKLGAASPDALASVCPLYGWLYLFHQHLTSKLTLYRYNTFRLREKAVGGDVLAFKGDLDYVGFIRDFVHRHDLFHFSLVLEVAGLTDYYPEGYKCPARSGETTEEPLTGLRSWPAVFSAPQDSALWEHWPNTVSLLCDNRQVLDKMRAPVRYYEKRTNFTYFLSRVEPRLTIVLIFREERKASDKNVNEFLSTLANSLRNTALFSCLKAGGSSKVGRTSGRGSPFPS